MPRAASCKGQSEKDREHKSYGISHHLLNRLAQHPTAPGAGRAFLLVYKLILINVEPCIN